MRYLLTVIFILSIPVIFAFNTKQATDSLLLVLKKTDSSPAKIKIYRDLADIYLDEADAKTYLLKMFNEASKINDKKNMLSALDDIIIGESNADNNKDTIEKYIGYVRKIATPEELRKLLPLYHMRIFDVRCYMNDKDEAIKEELNFLNSGKNGKDDIYQNIASVYTIGSGLYMSGQYEKSIPYLDKAMRLAESLPMEDGFPYQKFITWRLCFAYGRTGKDKKSIEKMERLINIIEQKYETDYKEQRPFYKIYSYLIQYYSYLFSGLPYMTIEKENYYWKRIQEIGKKITSDFDKYNYYLCANNYYIANHTKVDLPKAIAANDSLIKFAITLAPKNLSSLYNTGSTLHEQNKDYKKALKYLKISRHIKDSLNSEIAHKELNELQVKYDVNTLNNEKAKLEIKNKKILLFSLTILLIILISICTYLYFSLKKEKRLKSELGKMHLKAQESERIKQEFMNSICHEIRTPLNAIVGFSDLIMNEDIDADMRLDFPAEIRKNSELLAGLVGSMLEVANLDVSEEKLPCESADLKSILFQEMEHIRKKNGIKYDLDIQGESMFINTNAPYLAQVIGHLLDNANKFTVTGHIILDCKVDEDKKEIYIRVTDTGCGIPKDKHEEVFDRFSKLDSFVPGTGLGLYLCRLIIKRLGGKIKIDPDYSGGTRMIVTLPID